MKKIALVAAIAAISAPAFAQSSVTLYGRINTTIESEKQTGKDRVVKVNNNASRFGFRGVEDLGGGMKASFVLESGFDSSNGVAASSFWGRESHVDLTGSFGTVRLGNWTPGSYFATADYVSMHNHDTGNSEDKLYAGRSGGGFTTTNKIGWFSPNYEGFTAELAAHAGEGTNPRGYDASANYDQGPLHLGFGYSKQADAKQFAARALYELGAFTFGGYVQREEANATGKHNIYRLSGMYALGASEFHVNFGSASSASGKNDGATQYTLAYNYNLSKRTKVYGYYTNVNNKVGGSYFTGKAGVDQNSFAMGVRHNF